MNREGGQVSNCRSIPGQESVQAAEPFAEFWAKGTGASIIGNRSLTRFLTPSPDFFTRSRGERGECGGRRIGFSPRTPRLRVRLFIPLIQSSALMLPSTRPGAVFHGFHFPFFPSGSRGVRSSAVCGFICSMAVGSRRVRLTGFALPRNLLKLSEKDCEIEILSGPFSFSRKSLMAWLHANSIWH